MSTLDLGTLNELREMLEEGLDELLDEYLKDAPSQLSKLGDVIEAGDVQAISEVAHSLKGSSGNLGIRAVYSLCQQLEQEARGGSVADGAGSLKAIVEAFEQAQVDLADYRAG